MLSDFISRLFIIGFFVVYLVVAIFVVQWIFRTWFGRAERHPRSVKFKAARQPESPAPESTVAKQGVRSRADSGSLAAETSRHRSTTA